MTKKELAQLERGDIIRSEIGDGSSFVVVAKYADRVIAVRTVEVTNPAEWKLVVPHSSIKFSVVKQNICAILLEK